MSTHSVWEKYARTVYTSERDIPTLIDEARRLLSPYDAQMPSVVDGDLLGAKCLPSKGTDATKHDITQYFYAGLLQARQIFVLLNGCFRRFGWHIRQGLVFSQAHVDSLGCYSRGGCLINNRYTHYFGSGSSDTIFVNHGYAEEMGGHAQDSIYINFGKSLQIGGSHDTNTIFITTTLPKHNFPKSLRESCILLTPKRLQKNKVLSKLVYQLYSVTVDRASLDATAITDLGTAITAHCQSHYR
ncbi:hypothetical protein HY639_06190 [Candidatus Woesearchaeota archaeon]|nr:hypothetical protein [Candidatus Woesearchaeota archaeon]